MFPPEAEAVITAPIQGVVLFTEMAMVGIGLTPTATVPVPEHVPSDAATVYTVATVGLTM